MGDLKDGKVAMQPKVVPGCQTPVKDGTVIITGEYDKRDTSLAPLPYDPNYVKGGQPGERAKKAQADTLEGLLINHPLDCPVCDKAGECKLQDFQYQYGRSESRMVDEKNTPPNKPESIEYKITLFTDRCIMCTRCVRFTREISGTAELAVIGRGQPRGDRHLPRLATGEQTRRQCRRSLPGRRAWEQGLPLQATRLVSQDRPTASARDAAPAAASTSIANKDIVYRLRARENQEAQGYFICDEGRYGYHFANNCRANRFARSFAPMGNPNLRPGTQSRRN